MKLRFRNKKTGEIINCFAQEGTNPTLYDFGIEKSKDWEAVLEDAPEEPKEKEVWMIDTKYACVTSYITDGVSSSGWAFDKEIGNYFETKEAAENAVEKLKAWQRLKDKGFRFNRWVIPEEPKTQHIKLVIEAEMDVPDSPYDLDLLFGDGEE